MESLAQFIANVAEKRERVFSPIAVEYIKSAGHRSLALAAAHEHQQSIFVLIVPLEGEHQGELRVTHLERSLYSFPTSERNNGTNDSTLQHQWLISQIKQQQGEIVSWLAQALEALAKGEAAR